MAAEGARELEELLSVARGGNEAALGQALERYRAYLTVLARVQIGRRLQGKAEAADVVQEAFLEAARQFPRFRGEVEAEFISWLREILAGCLAHLIRHYFGTQRRDVRLERELEAELDNSSRALVMTLASPQSTPSERASRREQDGLLADALQTLPEDYREVIVLRHVEGLSFPQIAERMGRSLDSVEKLWLRAVTRLRQSVGTEP
jgi:RNA polymerase sigma-70 factor (ECF subfamily)